ncbi:MAG: hypothetical protein ACKO9I_00565, partial [Sphaerospermopsis kisseleviana]
SRVNTLTKKEVKDVIETLISIHNLRDYLQENNDASTDEVVAFKTIGYEICENDVLETGFQKIAIYANSNKIPTHIARQLPDGKWTSKLGQDEDIEHNNLQGLTGNPGYGEVAFLMKKPPQTFNFSRFYIYSASYNYSQFGYNESANMIAPSHLLYKQPKNNPKYFIFWVEGLKYL